PEEVPPPPEPEPTPEPIKEQPKPKPEPPKPEPPKPVPPKVVPPKVEPKPAEKKAETKPVEKKAEKKPEKKKDDFDSLLSAVNQLEKKVEKPGKGKQADAASTEEEATPQPQAARPTNQGGRISNTLTMSEIDSIRYHVEQRWNYNQGGRGVEGMSVDVQVSINPDGSVARAKALRDPAFAGDAVYKALADSAERAVMRASPLPVPRDKFDMFADGFTLRFAPTGINFN
ncbi:hypothetical protein, partial [Rhodospirillum rubrum]